jgi:transcriptional repressor NrdR
MRCPFCSNEDTQVAETRESDEGDVIRRRRRCSACDKRFTTYERPELQIPAIVKKDGSRVEYSRDKLRSSLMLALRKRPVSANHVDEAIEHIESRLIGKGEREVDSAFVGELVMRELKKLDKVAYVRFASVYKSFETVDEFSELVDEFNKRPTTARKKT